MIWTPILIFCCCPGYLSSSGLFSHLRQTLVLNYMIHTLLELQQFLKSIISSVIYLKPFLAQVDMLLFKKIAVHIPISSSYLLDLDFSKKVPVHKLEYSLEFIRNSKVD